MADLIIQLRRKLKEKYLKMLKAYAKGKMDKAIKLERKVIELEIALKDAKD